MNIRKIIIPSNDKLNNLIPHLYSLEEKKEIHINKNFGKVISLFDFLNSNENKEKEKFDEIKNPMEKFPDEPLLRTNLEEKDLKISLKNANEKEKAKIEKLFCDNKIKTFVIGRNKKLLSNDLKNKNLELLKEIEKKIEIKKLNERTSEISKFSKFPAPTKHDLSKSSPQNNEETHIILTENHCNLILKSKSVKDRKQDNLYLKDQESTNNKDCDDKNVNFNFTNLTKISNSNNYSKDTSINHSTNFENIFSKSNNNNFSSYSGLDNIEISNFKNLLNDNIKLTKNNSEDFIEKKEDHYFGKSIERKDRIAELFLEDDALNQDNNFLDVHLNKGHYLKTPAFHQVNLKNNFLKNEKKNSLLNKSRNDEKDKLIKEISETLKNCKEEFSLEWKTTDNREDKFDKLKQEI